MDHLIDDRMPDHSTAATGLRPRRRMTACGWFAQGPKWLTLIPGGGHEDSADIGGTRYARDVLAFTRINLRRN